MERTDRTGTPALQRQRLPAELTPRTPECRDARSRSGAGGFERRTELLRPPVGVRRLPAISVARLCASIWSCVGGAHAPEHARVGPRTGDGWARGQSPARRRSPARRQSRARRACPRRTRERPAAPPPAPPLAVLEREARADELSLLVAQSVPFLPPPRAPARRGCPGVPRTPAASPRAEHAATRRPRASSGARVHAALTSRRRARAPPRASRTLPQQTLVFSTRVLGSTQRGLAVGSARPLAGRAPCLARRGWTPKATIRTTRRLLQWTTPQATRTESTLEPHLSIPPWGDLHPSERSTGACLNL